MKIRIERITRKDGVNKKGIPYQKVGIYDGTVWMNGFDTDGWTASFTEGQEIDVTVYDSEYQGKIYKNFKKTTKTDLLEERVELLEDRVALLEGKRPAPLKMEKSEGEDEDGLPF